MWKEIGNRPLLRQGTCPRGMTKKSEPAPPDFWRSVRRAGIELCPMTGWSAARLPGRNVMVELEYVESLEEFRRGPQHVLQLAMTIERAAELIEALQQAITATPSRQITPNPRT